MDVLRLPFVVVDVAPRGVAAAAVITDQKLWRVAGPRNKGQAFSGFHLSRSAVPETRELHQILNR
jgi:hypothetical protein